MSRILYGVHGTGHGHAIRALTVARHYPQHQFLFVSHDDGIELLRPEYPVHECRNPETPIRAHRVDNGRIVLENLRFWRKKNQLMRSMVKLAEKFQPDVALTDYEFFVPHVCRQLGIPCLSFDHQHLITLSSFSTPLYQRPSRMIAILLTKHLFSETSAYLVTSFFQPPPRAPNVAITPPLLRESVLRNQPQGGEHVIAYQGYDTFSWFLPFLRNIKSPVLVYGLGKPHQDGNLIFKAYSEEEFLKNLASCRYVVCGGGHSLISEALFYGKPILSFPIKSAFEQFLNAYYLEKLGYGKIANTHRPSPKMIEDFENRLDFFCANIKKENFCGNDEIFRLLDRFIATGHLLYS